MPTYKIVLNIKDDSGLCLCPSSKQLALFTLGFSPGHFRVGVRHRIIHLETKTTKITIYSLFRGAGWSGGKT